MITSILGVDHVGVGVRDMQRMRSFYAEAFGFDRVLAEMPEEDHPAMHGLLRATRAVHSAKLIANERGGPTLALFRATDPVPRPIRTDPRYGDVGVAKLTFAVPDVAAFCRDKGVLVRFCSSPKSAALQDSRRHIFVYGRDPEGNLVEIVSAPGDAPETGPVLQSVGVAVTDLERSLAFYRDVLGFDRTVQAPNTTFSGRVDEVTGETGTTVRSCLLAKSRGTGMLELIEAIKPRGRSIPFGTQWGDFGYLQVCLYATGRKTLAAQIQTAGVDVLLPLQDIDDPENPAMFMYLRDPDGIPIEVVVGG
jgi:catechol 2,3-dioxygenase-like lactoylglutathione lyase family enzyme